MTGHRRPRRTRPLAAALVALVLPVLCLVPATPAQAGGDAAPVYRYWGYFLVEGGEYVVADTGPGDVVPEDGAVEAWRYAAPADFNAPSQPRADLASYDVETVCAGEEAAAGEKRVALLIDYGVEADAEGQDVPEPRAACAVVPEDATSLQALSAVADARTEDALLCAIDGYPAQGCGDQVDAATPADAGTVEFALPEAAAAEQGTDGTVDPADADTQDLEDGESSDTVLYAVVAVVVIALVVGGVVTARRRR